MPETFSPDFRDFPFASDSSDHETGFCASEKTGRNKIAEKIKYKNLLRIISVNNSKLSDAKFYHFYSQYAFSRNNHRLFSLFKLIKYSVFCTNHIQSLIILENNSFTFYFENLTSTQTVSDLEDRFSKK